MCPHILNPKYHTMDIGFLTVNELVSATRCQCNNYDWHFLLYERQFQDFQNIMKYVLFQLSLQKLVPWLTPY